MKKVATAIVVCLPFFTLAQQYDLPPFDSVKNELSKASADTNKVNLLWEISRHYYYNNQDSGLFYGEEGLKLAQQLDYKTGIGQAYYNIAMNYQLKGKNHEAIEYFFRAENIYARINGQRKWQARIKEGIGGVYMQIGKNDKALEYQLAALKLREDLNAYQDVAGNLSNIGNIYIMEKNYDKALEYYNKSFKLSQELKDDNGIANSLVNIGCALQGQKKYYSALENFFNARKIYEQLNLPTGISITLGNIGEAYLEMATDTARNERYAVLDNNSANINSAITYLNKAIEISKQNNLVDNIIEFSRYLSNAYEFSGNYKNALANYKEYAAMKDSEMTNSSSVIIANLETEQEREKQKLQLELKETQQKLFITGISFLVAIIAYGLRKFLIQLRSNKTLSKEKKMALDRVAIQKDILIRFSQTQAHDVRGPITTILGLISIFNYDDPADPQNKEILGNIAEVTERLDNTVKKIIKQENELADDERQTSDDLDK